MSVPVYDPQISVVLKKNIGRANIGGDIAASQRFQGTARTIDLTPWLGDAGGVKTSKSVRQPAGMFSIVLADRMEDSERDSLYAAIEPMDVIEIRMARDISKYTGAFTKHMPITMRGFVTSVRRSEIMTERGPRRAVFVNGQDYGKILQINQIVYMPFGPTGNRLLTNMNLFANYGITIDPDQDASEFVTQIVEKVVNVFIANMAAGATSTGVAQGITPLQVLGVDAIVHNGIVSPVGTNQWPGGTVYDLLRHFGDVGAWNELYVEDREDAPYLVYRPNPFKTIAGDWIQDPYKSAAAARPGVSRITDEDVVSLEPERTDAGVANWYWTDNASYQLVGATTLQAALAAGAATSTIYLSDYPNSSPYLYGFRRLEVPTYQGPRFDGKKADEFNRQSVSAIDFVNAKRQLLIDQNKDNVVFEAGSMSIKGNGAIKAGSYVNLARGANAGLVAEYYCHRVTHDFAPFRRYTTQVSFDRGTGFIQRVQRKDGAYLPEMRVRGVYAGG
jgi:hypothetical protein